MNKIDKIVVVGGGSSGWMSAATLINSFPNKEIIVIESPDTPTVGVGESTIGQINEWMYSLGIKDEDWMKFCDASYKFSIKFTDFYKKGAGAFHYPFGVPFYNKNEFPRGMEDWYVRKSLQPELPLKNFAETFFPVVALCEENRITENKKNEFPGWSFSKDVAYHFDAARFGVWLREHYCKPRGVKHIFMEVSEVKTSDKGVKCLVLTDGTEITSDLYIDCTGFKSMLLEQALGVKFETYESYLPNNSAWATRIPYTNRRKEIEPFTNCTAISNGWVWNIPLFSRTGSGYVFCDKYISDNDALEEFKDYLMNEREVKISKEVMDSLEFKLIKFRTGIHEKIFHKNVVGIGLAGGFIEPLESTGLYTVHEFLIRLVLALSRGEISEFDRLAFNQSVKAEFRSMAEFVGLHYSLSHRDDSKYWNDLREREFPVSKDTGLFLSFGFDGVIYKRYYSNSYTADMGGAPCIATGLNFLPLDERCTLKRKMTRNSLYHDNQGNGLIVNDVDYIKNLELNHFRMWDMTLAARKEYAKRFPYLSDYLDEKYKDS
ncbi:tryptophan 7-halogenase [bacterium]|nr:tryptophan 7-halogenase [bacterium]